MADADENVTVKVSDLAEALRMQRAVLAPSPMEALGEWTSIIAQLDPDEPKHHTEAVLFVLFVTSRGLSIEDGINLHRKNWPGFRR